MRGTTQLKVCANSALAKISSSRARALVVDAIAGGVRAQARGELAQDAVDFASFFLGEAHQFVVELDGFERLDEKGVAAAAGSVNHAIDAALAAGDYGHHEAVVADGDEVFLQRAVRMMRAQEAFERMLDCLALLFDVAAQAAQRDAGVIGQHAAGKNLAAQLLRQLAQIGDGGAVRGQPGESLAGGDQNVRAPRRPDPAAV